MSAALKLAVSPEVQEVPFIDLKRAFQGRQERIQREWADVLANAEFVGGRRVAQLEAALTGKLGVAETLACANGTDALILALQAAGVGPGKRVALPNLTFWASYEAIVQLGAAPVLVDIELDSLQMDLAELKRAHERHGLFAACLPHLYGWATPELAGFRSYCRAHGIALVEDGAQSFGVRVDGKPVYADAMLATLSFYPAKVLGGAMDGGAVTASDPALTAACRVLANHGRSSHYSYSQVGWNSRMGGLQAAFLLDMLDCSGAAISSRRRALGFYHHYLEDEIEDGLLRFWMPPWNVEGNGYLATLTVPGRDPLEVQKKLQARGVGSGRTYPETIIDQPCVRRDILRVSELERSREFSRSVLNLPLFGFITEAECRFAADALIAIVREES